MDLPLTTAIITLVLPSGGSLVGGVLYLTCIHLVWLNDVSMTSPALLNDVGQASSLLLNSNDRVGSFYWSRGSKLGFLTSLSYLNCYFLILGFLCSHCLLVSLRLS